MRETPERGIPEGPDTVRTRYLLVRVVAARTWLDGDGERTENRGWQEALTTVQGVLQSAVPIRWLGQVDVQVEGWHQGLETDT